jgi:hypothetical protein
MRPAYDSLIASGALKPDPNQLALVNHLQAYQQQLLDSTYEHIQFKNAYSRIADFGEHAEL